MSSTPRAALVARSPTQELASDRRASVTFDVLCILLVWLTSLVLTFTVQPNYDEAPVSQQLYYTFYNVGIGWLIGFHQFDRLARQDLSSFAALSCVAIAAGTLINEAVVEPEIFRTGPINGEGVYYGLVDAATTAAFFLLIRLGALLRREKKSPSVHLAPGPSPAAPSAPTAAEGDCIFVRVADETRRVLVADVIYLKAERDFTHIVCCGCSLFASESLKRLLEKSRPLGFVRVHKSFAVNLRRVDRLTRTEVGLGHWRVPVGRRYWPALAEMWRQGPPWSTATTP
jgi:hypothetical protein